MYVCMLSYPSYSDTVVSLCIMLPMFTSLVLSEVLLGSLCMGWSELSLNVKARHFPP